MLLTHFDVTLTSFLGGVINCVKRLIHDSSWRCQELQFLIIFTMILLLKWSRSSKIMQNMLFHIKLYSLTLSTLKTCRQMGEALPHRPNHWFIGCFIGTTRELWPRRKTKSLEMTLQTCRQNMSADGRSTTTSPEPFIGCFIGTTRELWLTLKTKSFEMMSKLIIRVSMMSNPDARNLY